MLNIDALPRHITRHVAAALAEDVGSGDLTAALINPATRVQARITSREQAVLCGIAWAAEVFRQLDKSIRLEWLIEDGEQMEVDTTVCKIEGPARPVMTGERTALNYLQSLSGTATLARQFADAVKGTSCSILDTRKTVPGLRLAQKYAVRCGGCTNHRTGLYDGILIKENHILAAGSVASAVAAARDLESAFQVEVEVEHLDEFSEALMAGADNIMLDDFSLDDIQAAVAKNQGRARLEVSGSMDLGQVRQVAETGVDFISVGALTKHLRAVDLSLRVDYPAHSAEV